MYGIQKLLGSTKEVFTSGLIIFLILLLHTRKPKKHIFTLFTFTTFLFGLVHLSSVNMVTYSSGALSPIAWLIRHVLLAKIYMTNLPENPSAINRGISNPRVAVNSVCFYLFLFNRKFWSETTYNNLIMAFIHNLTWHSRPKPG